MRSMHPPRAVSKSVFGKFIFSLISSLFDSNKPDALRTHNRKSANKMVMHKELASKKLNKICLKCGQKALKWSLQHLNFQTFSRGHGPGPPEGVPPDLLA